MLIKYTYHTIHVVCIMLMCMLIPSLGMAQSDGLLKNKFKTITSPYLIISDSLTIIPESIKIYTTDTLELDYHLDSIRNNNHYLSLTSPTYPATIQVQYRTLYKDIGQVYSRIDTSKLTTKDQVIYIGYEYSPFEVKNGLIESKGLDYDGSFSRGFSLGNSQSLLLNSNFNLQMAGDLGNDIRIKAAISDDNIPIQAEGNTQVLQEFDRVYIQVDKQNTSIIAGDFEEQQSQSYFLRYLKKLKGLKVQHKENLGSKGILSGAASFAQSQGKFSRQTVPTVEGNQGPYKLNGNNGELYLIVRSGTEKVYYDGKLLKRGIDEDYTISYDRAELIFTQQVLITKDSRIVIEFEYLDQNYQRTSYIAQADYEIGKFKFSTNLYTETDSKNLQQEIQLDSVDIRILEEAGDDLAETQRTGVREYNLEFDPELILYQQLSRNDTIYYEYTTEPALANYLVSFSNVGVGLGSYSIDNLSAANGRVYKYVGEGLGSFAPIKKLTAPQKKQILTLATSYSPNENRLISAELAMSDTDLNRFSQLDDSDNQGIAFNIFLKDKIRLSDKENGWVIRPEVLLETVQPTFKTINPYRSPEFDRDWNQSVNLDSVMQQIISGSLFIEKNKNLKLGYTYKSLDLEDQYSGTKHIGNVLFKDQNRTIDIQLDQLLTTSLIETTNFVRPTVVIEHALPFFNSWRASFDLLSETNKRKKIGTDTLTPLSLSFDQYDFRLRNKADANLHLNVGYQHRIDRLPEGDGFTEGFAADKYSIQSNWKQNSHSNLNIEMSYRNLKVLKPDQVTQESGSNLLARADYNWILFNNGIKSNTSYTVGSGQELKREFEYVEVERGQGNYVWVDSSPEDGIQQQVEFIQDIQSDTANFIIVTIFNNEFIRTNTNSLTQSFRINPDKFISKTTEKKWLKYLSKVSMLTNIKFDQKTLKTENNQIRDFFKFDIGDTSVVRYNGALNNTLFVNRASTVWDLQIGNKSISNRFTQVTGLETRNIKEYFSRLRLSPSKRLDIILNTAILNTKNDSEQFVERDFDINESSISPELNIRPSSILRFILRYSRIEKTQLIRNQENLKSHDFTLETSYRQIKKLNLNTSISYVNVSFTGEQNTPVAFELLNGLKAGENFIWNLSVTKRLANNVDFIASYEGRKTGEARMIHTARAQVKASF